MMRDKVEIAMYAWIGVLTALQLTLIVLKLCSVISWAWWLVALPALINSVLTIAMFLVWIALLVVENWNHGEKRRR